MNYEDIAQHARDLGYRDKLKLAQFLLQLAVKEEEEQNPEKRTSLSSQGKSAMPDETVEYVAPRLLKLRPTKKGSVMNSIAAMYQFQGGISDADKERIFASLVRQGYIREEANNRISYPSNSEA